MVFKDLHECWQFMLIIYFTLKGIREKVLLLSYLSLF